MTNHEPVEREDSPEKSSKIAYHIPLRDGVFQVTQEAHETYGLVPLTPNATNGVVQNLPKKTDQPFVHVILASPGELEDSDRDTLDAGEAGSFINTIIIDNQIVFTIALSPHLADEMEIPEDLINNEQESDALIEDQIGQFYAHTLTGLVEKITSKNSVFQFLSEVENKFQKKVRTRQVLGASGFAAVAINGLYNGQNNTPTLLAVAFANYLLQTTLLQSTLRKHSREQLDGTTQMIANLKARTLASSIASDIHESYCSSHFASQFNLDTPGE